MTKEFNILDMPADLAYLSSKALETKMNNYISYLQKMDTSDLDDTCEVLKAQVDEIYRINQIRNYKLEEEKEDEDENLENEKEFANELIENSIGEFKKINCNLFKDCVGCPLYNNTNNTECVKEILESLLNQ